MLYLYAFLSRSRFCHALCIPWACFCVVAFIPLVAYWGVTTYETHPRDAGLLNAYPFSAPCCLPCLLYATRLAFFASMHSFFMLATCSCMSLCLFVSSSLISTISCGFTPVFDTRDLKSLLGILLDGTYVVHTPI